MQTLSRNAPDRPAKSAAAKVDSNEMFAKIRDGSADQNEADRRSGSPDAFRQDEALALFEDDEPREARQPTTTARNVEPPPVAAAEATFPQVAPAPREHMAPAIIEDFPSQPPEIVPAGRRRRQFLLTAAIVGLSIVAAVQAVFLIRSMRGGEAAAVALPATGIVSVQSTPAGAAVSVNGQARGVTPLTLTLSPGDYSIDVSNGRLSRAVPVSVAAGTRSSQHVLFGGDTQARGGLQITSQPPGARVTVDDVSRGTTPLTLADLAPGAHVVVLDGASGTSRQNVTIQPGSTASLAVTMPVAGAAGGFVRVTSPFDVQLYENASLIGSSQSERIMLPAGRHTIDVVNTALGYQAAQTVQVSPGGTATVRIDPPAASVDVNAAPWAEVTIGGRSVGTTPLGNVQVPIGAHEFTFRHPQLGERRLTANITVRGPNRVTVNMNQK